MRIGAITDFQRPAAVERPVAPARPVRAVQEQLATKRESSLEFTITTDEGDRVTFSAKALSQLNASRSSQPGSYSASRETSDRVELSVSIEGDLSDKELADIQKLTRTLAQSAAQASRGNLQQAQRFAAKATRIDSIASFDFSYQSQASLEYARRAYQQDSQAA